MPVANALRGMDEWGVNDGLSRFVLHFRSQEPPMTSHASMNRIYGYFELATFISDHLYWPQLDADLSVESIRNPLAFPLISKAAG